ncbi:hypothetical protein Ciccas_012768 [Cichlidogyrus casuarinus]|uniref:Uncharacterized protein n=1 Tax=Cichlidogyrus casuarinus TaxID=1844966 RepID=A0ABD2PQG8_9PLAT
MNISFNDTLPLTYPQVENFFKRFDAFLWINKVTDESKKKAALFVVCGQEAFDKIVDILDNSEDPLFDERVTYEQIKWKLICTIEKEEALKKAIVRYVPPEEKKNPRRPWYERVFHASQSILGFLVQMFMVSSPKHFALPSSLQRLSICSTSSSSQDSLTSDDSSF